MNLIHFLKEKTLEGDLILMANEISSEIVRELLSYDPESGIFVWLTRPSEMFSPTALNTAQQRADQWNKRWSGKIAGKKGPHYVTIQILGKKRDAHRLAWLYMTGEWPKDEIDHWDTNKHNNAFRNLREATSSQNKSNKAVRRDCASGIKGVKKAGRKWTAAITENKRRRHIGTFDCPAAASLAYQIEALRAFGKFART